MVGGGQPSIGIVAAGALVLAACSSNPSSPNTNGNSAGASVGGKGGAQLWQENCSLCHNIRSPTEFSNTEWEILGHHMRIRANLTGDEQRRIVAFIQSANQ